MRGQGSGGCGVIQSDHHETADAAKDTIWMVVGVLALLQIAHFSRKPCVAPFSELLQCVGCNGRCDTDEVKSKIPSQFPDA
jgi:hypothetical protein